MVHTKEKPHTCNICSTSFTQKSSLKGNVEAIDGDLKYRSPHLMNIIKTHLVQNDGNKIVRSDHVKFPFQSSSTYF